MTGESALVQGQEAYRRCAWSEAFAYLSAVDDETPLEPADLELLATAAYLSGHDESSAGTWTRAHQAHLEVGEQAAAVRCAFWLGFGLLQRGEMAQGSGWIARARSLVEDGDLVCAEAGYLLLPAGLMAMGGGDHETALELFEQARTAGQRFDDPDLAALGRLGRGQALLKIGRPSDGLEQFDEAMVAVTAGELSPVAAGIVYCGVIEACQHAFDVRRAGEWTAALSRWCDAQPGLVPYRGQCMVHRAQVMQRRGAWKEALSEAQRACEWLADPPHPAVGMAYYQLGELHRVRGEQDDAERAYRQANESGHVPQPGLALLRLSQDRIDSATAAIERAVEEAPDLTTRVRMLPACVEILLAAGRVDGARTAAGELANCAAWIDTPYVHAVAAHSRGAVLLAEGSPGNFFTKLDLPNRAAATAYAYDHGLV